jgi:osmotically-inducible protein OsmY
MPRCPSLLLVGSLSLLLGSLIGAGCTPNSSGSTASSETTPAPVEAAAQPAQDSSTASPPSSSADDDRTVAQRLEDASVAARVKQALVQNRTLRRFTFSPSATDGRVTLRGDVNTQAQYRLAERIAQREHGVAAVTNQVTVEGRAVSTTDGSEEAEQTDATYHTIRRGDTLIEIARAYDVSVRQIRALNDLSGALQPGQEIRVR